MQPDLHCHSTASDGSYAPAALAELMQGGGVSLWSLTDHDTCAGLAEAARRSRELGLRFLPGSELSCQWQRIDLHVVALGMDVEHAGWQAHIERLQQCRLERARRIAEKIAQRGGGELLAAACAAAAPQAPTRPHFAELLVANGICADHAEAFRRWLGRKGCANVRAQWPGLDESVSAITAAGGVAVLAHPQHYGLSNGKLRRLLDDFAAAGGEGMEVWMPGLNKDQRGFYLRLCEQRGLYASGGSDFHGDWQHWARPGALSLAPASEHAIWQHPRLRKQLAAA